MGLLRLTSKLFWGGSWTAFNLASSDSTVEAVSFWSSLYSTSFHSPGRNINSSWRGFVPMFQWFLPSLAVSSQTCGPVRGQRLTGTPQEICGILSASPSSPALPLGSSVPQPPGLPGFPRLHEIVSLLFGQGAPGSEWEAKAHPTYIPFSEESHTPCCSESGKLCFIYFVQFSSFFVSLFF